ncbi:MAG: dihydrolipoyl dehydrogenase [Deltaproteobacteria bacterium]|nr:dihydrolipoyl dehydrogenase [Deltaproteobacteria bacterium]
MEKFDVCIIGGGPAGYVSALKCAINGLSAAIIEKERFGGTCLNRGCIPTKVLYSKAKYLKRLKEPERGFSVSGFNFNFDEIINYKDEVVSSLTGGVEKLLKARKVNIFYGTGKIAGKKGTAFQVEINSKDDLSSEISADKVIVATGSVPLMIPAFNIDHKNIITSDEALSLRTIPGSLIIIGAGVIGCEFANIFSEFGSEVRMIELLPTILSTEDKEISKFIQKNFKSRNIDIMTGAEVAGIKASGSNGKTGAEVELKTGERLEAEKVLVSIGRKLNTAGLGLEETGVKLDNRGKIETDAHNETNIKGIYACGDITDGPMLAHKASYDGIIAADNIAGIIKEKDYAVLPWSVYTNPAIGTVGLKEGDAGLSELKYSVGRFSYAASGMALAMEEPEGFLKVIADEKSKKILGATGIGADIPELIAEIASYMHFGGTVFDIESTIHSHPTLSEIVPESALDSIGEAIHKFNPRTAKKG